MQPRNHIFTLFLPCHNNTIIITIIIVIPNPDLYRDLKTYSEKCLRTAVNIGKLVFHFYCQAFSQGGTRMWLCLSNGAKCARFRQKLTLQESQNPMKDFDYRWSAQTSYLYLFSPSGNVKYYPRNSIHFPF